MFTGIIGEIGRVAEAGRRGRLLAYAVSAPGLARAAAPGASVSVDGVCQTVTSAAGGLLRFEAMEETLSKTTLGSLAAGVRVHLEPALRLGDPLDGHLVYGHVDGVGRVAGRRALEGRFDLRVCVPGGLGRYLVEGGSVALQGVSLTCFEVRGDEFSVSLVPETLERTLLGDLLPGSPVNVETDPIGKWVEKLAGGAGKPGLEERLRGWGY